MVTFKAQDNTELSAAVRGAHTWYITNNAGFYCSGLTENQAKGIADQLNYQQQVIEKIANDFNAFVSGVVDNLVMHGSK